MPTVKYSISDYIADGTTTDYLITWDYLDDDHITVEIDGVTNSDPLANHTFIKLNNTTVRVTDTIGSAIVSGKEIQIKRATPITTRPISFSDGSALLAADLNKNSDYLLYSMQEALDQVDFSIQFQKEAEGFKDATEVLRDETQALRNLSEADEQTATQQATISTTKAGEAAGSAAAALVSENAASVSAGEALASKNEATTQAGLATTNGAAQVSLAAGQVALATTQAGLATTNGATQVSLAAGQVALATTQVGLATTKASDASGSASTASGHANTATTQAGIATTKAGEASTSATTATTKAGEASTSASAAAGSASSAANSAASAATALDNFEDKYLGSLSSEPTLDLDGNALVSGALYFSQTSSSMQVYDGANWIAASSAGVASLNLFEYTATAGQTTFTGNDDNGAAMSYIVGNNIVALNGVILDPSDFSDASGLSIVLTAGATVGDLLNVYAFKSFTVADTVSKTSGGTFNADVTVLGTLAATTVTGDGSALTGLPAGYTDADVASYLAGVGNVVVGGTLTASEASVSKINDANGDDALTITSDSTVQVHNEIEFIGAAGLNAHIQKNAASGRDELQIYSATDANGAGSRGAGMHLYGNSDNEHSGNVAFITGPDDGGEGRMFVSGWDTNTHVTIGNGPTGQTIWQFVDSENDKALLNLINPTDGPALFIMEANGSTEGDITVNDGESLHFGHWNYGTSTYTHRMAMTPSGLDVVGGITAGGDVTFDTTTLHVDSTNSRVGIGTISPTNQLNIEDTGDVKVVVKTTGTGDADATLVLDSADTGESVLQFEHDGVYGAKVEWFTDGAPDLNISTVGASSVIDIQPNGVRTGRFDVNGLEVTGTVAATSFTGNGSALTGVGGSTAYGAVGTYATGRPDNKTTYAPADTVSGIISAGGGDEWCQRYNLPAFGWIEGTAHGALSGTWRSMNGAEGNTSSSDSATSSSGLWVRIS